MDRRFIIIGHCRDLSIIKVTRAPCASFCVAFGHFPVSVAERHVFLSYQAIRFGRGEDAFIELNIVGQELAALLAGRP